MEQWKAESQNMNMLIAFIYATKTLYAYENFLSWLSYLVSTVYVINMWTC